MDAASLIYPMFVMDGVNRVDEISSLPGQYRYTVDRMEEELGYSATLIATGGLAQFITPLCRHSIILDKDLLMKGLNIIYKKNKKA